MQTETRYHIQELVDASGISRRTIHYYISIGLLPHAKGTGRNGHYTQTHMDRLMRIRQLKDQFVVLKDIRKILEDEEEEKQRKILSVREEGPEYDAQVQPYPLSLTIAIHDGVQVIVPMQLYTQYKPELLQAIQTLEQTLIQLTTGGMEDET